MRRYTVISLHQDISGVFFERMINAKTEETAKDLACAQYLGGCVLVKIADPKGQTEVYTPSKEELDA